MCYYTTITGADDDGVDPESEAKKRCATSARYNDDDGGRPAGQRSGNGNESEIRGSRLGGSG